jgi:hypothetical protein
MYGRIKDSAINRAIRKTSKYGVFLLSAGIFSPQMIYNKYNNTQFIPIIISAAYLIIIALTLFQLNTKCGVYNIEGRGQVNKKIDIYAVVKYIKLWY